MTKKRCLELNYSLTKVFFVFLHSCYSKSTIGGGEENAASGELSAILGGLSNTASGEKSMTLGSNGNASDAYAAVLSFDSTGTTCDSQGVGTVNICADGGVFINNVLLDSGSMGDFETTELTSALNDVNESMIIALTTLDIEIDAVEAGVHTMNTSLNALQSTVEGHAGELISLDFETTELTTAFNDLNE